MRKPEKLEFRFVLCLRVDGADDLEIRKVYEVWPDRGAARDGYLRVIDESGEDYLYPAAYFAPVKLPAAIARESSATAKAKRPRTHAPAATR